MTSKPLIGLTCNFKDNYFQLPSSYAHAIHAAGGLPVVLPPLENLSEITSFRRRLDGFLIIGGSDIDASRYGLPPHPEMTSLPPLRENWEFALAKELLEHSRQPLLGICLGCQIINVAAGGTLFRHLPEDVPKSIEHRKVEKDAENFHPVRVKPGSLLSDILGCEELRCNTSHHQAVDAVAPGFEAQAWSEDGVIEAICLQENNQRFCLGIQWHPERIHQQTPHDKIFAAMTAHC